MENYKEFLIRNDITTAGKAEKIAKGVKGPCELINKLADDKSISDDKLVKAYASAFRKKSLANVLIEEGAVDGELRRAVCVQHAACGLWRGGHLLSSQADVVHVERLAAAEQLSELRGVAAAGDGVVLQVLAQQTDVHSRLFGHDIQCASHGEHGVEVLHGGVEGEVAVAGDAAPARQLPFLAYEVYEVEQCLVLYHHALGLARGA